MTLEPHCVLHLGNYVINDKFDTRNICIKCQIANESRRIWLRRHLNILREIINICPHTSRKTMSKPRRFGKCFGIFRRYKKHAIELTGVGEFGFLHTPCLGFQDQISDRRKRQKSIGTFARHGRIGAEKAPAFNPTHLTFIPSRQKIVYIEALHTVDIREPADIRRKPDHVDDQCIRMNSIGKLTNCVCVRFAEIQAVLPRFRRLEKGFCDVCKLLGFPYRQSDLNFSDKGRLIAWIVVLIRVKE